MEKKRELIISIVAIVVLVLAIVGVSFAAFNYSRTGEKINTITSGAISMQYTETDNVIQIDKALPTTDATGTVRLKEGEYFDFSVSGTIQGTANINWEIAAEDITTADRKIDGSNIKLYLTEVNDSQETEVMSPRVYSENDTANEYTGRPAGQMSLYATTSSTSFTKNYRLRMYVDENYNPQDDGGDLVFTIRVNVYGKTGDPMRFTVAETLLNGVGSNGAINTSDPDQTFITGTDPNNYIWYSGKLWRAVSIDPDDNSVKLVTQWNISAVPYTPLNQAAFEGSYMEQWLNDTSVDGFLGNLRNYENFIKMDSVWNATTTTQNFGSITELPETILVTDAVGLLNIYEYQVSSSGTDYSNGYLNNGLIWWTLTPFNGRYIHYVRGDGFSPGAVESTNAYGVRPSINLKSSARITSGDGTENNPYRLEGDNDTDLNGTLLNTRYSGEYIQFGTGENTLYRIVSHETNGLTKITSAEPLKSSGTFITSAFGSSSSEVNYSSSNTIGSFLNGDYLTSYVGDNYSSMIEPSTTWYLGTVGSGTSYRLAKYSSITGNDLTTSTTDAQVGLLRLGELMVGQFERDAVKGGSTSTKLRTFYWTLTPYSTYYVRNVQSNGIPSEQYSGSPTQSLAVRPAMNLKSSVIITGGDGTKNNPFTIALNS